MPATHIDVEHYRKVLLAHRDRLREGLSQQQETTDEGDTITAPDYTPSELSSYDNHPADVGTEVFEKERDLALYENSRDLLRKVEYALERIEDGTYGLSERSGQPIPAERLEAVPWATLTVEEQEIAEAL